MRRMAKASVLLPYRAVIVVALASALQCSESLAQDAGLFIQKARVNALSSVTFTWSTTGGLVFIDLKGDGDTDLDLFIYDERGTLIRKSDGPTDSETVIFLAPRGTLKIRIVNLGIVFNDCLVTMGSAR